MGDAIDRSYCHVGVFGRRHPERFANCSAVAFQMGRPAMNVFILMLLGIVGFALAGLAVFGWALKSGQFEDPKGAAARILDESDRPR